MPVAFSRYRELGRLRTICRVLRRVALLFLLGMVVQGNLCSGEPEKMSLCCNTLQAIAPGYLLSAVVLVFWGWRGQLASCVLLLAAYWALMRFVPYNGQPADSSCYIIIWLIILTAPCRDAGRKVRPTPGF